MQHLFVPYELALELKSKGFNEPCLSVYSNKGKLSPLVNFGVQNSNVPSYCTAPIYQQVIDWFMEKHNLYITIIPIWNNIGYSYGYQIRNIIDNSFLEFMAYANPNKTLNKGIEEALKLIK